MITMPGDVAIVVHPNIQLCPLVMGSLHHFDQKVRVILIPLTSESHFVVEIDRERKAVTKVFPQERACDGFRVDVVQWMRVRRVTFTLV